MFSISLCPPDSGQLVAGAALCLRKERRGGGLTSTVHHRQRSDRSARGGALDEDAEKSLLLPASLSHPVGHSRGAASLSPSFTVQCFVFASDLTADSVFQFPGLRFRCLAAWGRNSFMFLRRCAAMATHVSFAVAADLFSKHSLQGILEEATRLLSQFSLLFRLPIIIREAITQVRTLTRLSRKTEGSGHERSRFQKSGLITRHGTKCRAAPEGVEISNVPPSREQREHCSECDTLRGQKRRRRPLQKARNSPGRTATTQRTRDQKGERKENGHPQQPAPPPHCFVLPRQ